MDTEASFAILETARVAPTEAAKSFVRISIGGPNVATTMRASKLAKTVFSTGGAPAYTGE